MIDYGLSYDQGDGVNLMGYIDSDWASSVVDRKKHLRVLLQLGIDSRVLV
jgi:hypothetical protein